MVCNTVQNEVGGKSLLLKVCAEKTFTVDGIVAAITVTGHGLSVGDPVVFSAEQLGDITNLVANRPYYVKTVTDANTIEIAATPTGTAIIPDAAETGTFSAFLNVGGIRSKGITFTSEGIDITSQDSDEWSKMLDAAGIRSCALSGSGVYTNEANYLVVEEAAFNNNLICLMFIDVKGYKTLWGCYKITQIENSGDYNAEGNFTISASSSGEIYRYKAV